MEVSIYKKYLNSKIFLNKTNDYITFLVSAIPIEEKKPPRFIQFPDYDGVYHLIDLENEDLSPHKFDPDRDVRFLLFNRYKF